MRLTLRTLLAYLDHALPPAEAQEIAHKLQTSPVATKLADRIGELLRSGDCGPAPTLDPNVVAGYLDNTLEPDEILAVETVCLESPAQIEETAACHQLLFRGTLAQPALSTAGRERLNALTPGASQRAAAPAAPATTTSAEEASLRVPRWYYRLFGQEFGPVPIDLLIQVIASGQLKPADEVRADPNPQWVRIQEFLAGTVPADKNNAAATPVTSPAAEVPIIADEWFCQSKTVEEGPHTFDELVFHARQGSLDPGDQIRFGRQGAWRRAGSIGRLMAEFPFQSMSAASAPSPAPPVNEHKQNATTAPQRNAAGAVAPGGMPLPAAQASATAQPDEWYVLLGNQTCGPMKLAELLDWFRAGRLQPTDGIRQGATSNWMYAGMLPMLLATGQAFPSPPSPLPPVRT